MDMDAVEAVVRSAMLAGFLLGMGFGVLLSLLLYVHTHRELFLEGDE